MRSSTRIRPMTQRRSVISIIDALSDSNLFGQYFENANDWRAWKIFLKSLFGIPLDEGELDLFTKCTGRRHPPQGGTDEAWLVVGRRGGKSFILALIAVYLACFKDWKQYLGPGERATVMVIAADRKQARVIMRYCKGLLQSVPMLAKLVDGDTTESVRLSNRVIIEVHTASFRSVRGYTVIACLCDEIAFWATEDSASPDYEVLNALRPAMATVQNAMLLCASSPYARKGALWDAHRRYHGQDGPVLVWQAPTRTMNPRVDQSIIDAATERDPAHAAAEYLAQFRSDIESFVNRDAVEACVSMGVRERAPVPGIAYRAFVDPSGGQHDSMTLAIAHREDKVKVLDCVREIRPPFSPESAVGEFAQLLKTYRITQVTGDRYAGEWPREQFRKHGITYEPAAKPKSALYVDLLPLVNSRQVDLIDDPRLINQLCSLERRTARSGKDSIDHAPGGHDDVANAVTGVVGQIASGVGSYIQDLSWVDGPEPSRRRQYGGSSFADHLNGVVGVGAWWR